ncbi:hypothetical protein [Streptococcus merionis]|uniref:hypothetical protein n=1 Tax=Streptococcus merionis TaxID=400065 RepID=UPI0035186C45
MDWVTLGTIVANVAVLLGVFVQLVRDNKSLSNELGSLSKEHDSLLKEHERLSKEHADIQNKVVLERKIVSRDTQSIKEDTKYISDEMKLEKMAREKLYQNSSRAKEILETVDMMKEIVLQNAQLHEEVLKLKLENQDLVQSQDDEKQLNLFMTIERFERQLVGFESYKDTEEIQALLKKIKNELSDIR